MKARAQQSSPERRESPRHSSPTQEEHSATSGQLSSLKKIEAHGRRSREDAITIPNPVMEVFQMLNISNQTVLNVEKFNRQVSPITPHRKHDRPSKLTSKAAATPVHFKSKKMLSTNKLS